MAFGIVAKRAPTLAMRETMICFVNVSQGLCDCSRPLLVHNLTIQCLTMVTAPH